MRIWLRRPNSLRVESLDGRLLKVWHTQTHVNWSAMLRLEGAPHTGAGPHQQMPEFDQDGFVVRRSRSKMDEPIHDTYLLAAALDPVELADGQEGSDESGERSRGPLAFDALPRLVSGGRLAWEAVVRPTARYEPLCPCCPLLPSEVADNREAESGGVPLRERFPGFSYPSAHRVQLDVATGVCVLTEALGGTADAGGHDLLIEAVDEPMDDALFGPRRSLLGRVRWGGRR